MAEVVGLVASIVQIAGTGAKLSSALYNFTTSAVRADQDIADIASDIELTSNALESVGQVFKTEDTGSIVSKKAIVDANSIIKRCEAVFKDIAELVEKGRTVPKHGKRNLSVIGKLAWPMKEQRVELYRRRLESLKNSLTLLLHVLQLAQGQARGQLEKNTVEHEREKIRELHQQQQDSLRSLQALEAKLSEVSIDDKGLLEGSKTTLPTPSTHLLSVSLKQDPELRLRTGNFESTPSGPVHGTVSDGDTSESDGSATDGEEDPVSSEELAKAEQHVRKLLKRITQLQQSSVLSKHGKCHNKRHMNRIYQRFCRNWETNLMNGYVVPRWVAGHHKAADPSKLFDLTHSSISSEQLAYSHEASSGVLHYTSRNPLTRKRRYSTEFMDDWDFYPHNSAAIPERQLGPDIRKDNATGDKDLDGFALPTKATEFHSDPNRCGQQAFFGNQYHIRKDDASSTPLVSPAVTPHDARFESAAFDVPGAYFSPLTSPTLKAQNLHQTHQQSQSTSSRSSTGHSPMDVNLSVETPIAHQKTRRRLRSSRKRGVPRLANASARVRPSPIVKVTRRKANRDSKAYLQEPDLESIESAEVKSLATTPGQTCPLPLLQPHISLNEHGSGRHHSSSGAQSDATDLPFAAYPTQGQMQEYGSGSTQIVSLHYHQGHNTTQGYMPGMSQPYGMSPAQAAAMATAEAAGPAGYQQQYQIRASEWASPFKGLSPSVASIENNTTENPSIMRADGQSIDAHATNIGFGITRPVAGRLKRKRSSDAVSLVTADEPRNKKSRQGSLAEPIVDPVCGNGSEDIVDILLNEWTIQIGQVH